MTIDEMKQELKKAGYTVHEKMDEKLLKRRGDVYFRIFDYIGTKRYRYFRQYGKYAYIYCIEQYAQNEVRKRMKAKFGHIDYSRIPDEQWPAVRDELWETAKGYIDRRFEKLRP